MMDDTHARSRVQVLVTCKRSKQCLLAAKTHAARIMSSLPPEATK